MLGKGHWLRFWDASLAWGGIPGISGACCMVSYYKKVSWTYNLTKTEWQWTGKGCRSFEIPRQGQRMRNPAGTGSIMLSSDGYRKNGRLHKQGNNFLSPIHISFPFLEKWRLPMSINQSWHIKYQVRQPQLALGVSHVNQAAQLLQMYRVPRSLLFMCSH